MYKYFLIEPFPGSGEPWKVCLYWQSPRWKENAHDAYWKGFYSQVDTATEHLDAVDKIKKFTHTYEEI
jgi:hypothetical protein